MSSIETRNESYFNHRDSGRLSNQQQLILNRINESNERYGVHDHSLREIAAITKLEINAVSGRVNELKTVGLLVEGPARKCKVSGRTVTPVRVADEG